MIHLSTLATFSHLRQFFSTWKKENRQPFFLKPLPLCVGWVSGVRVRYFFTSTRKQNLCITESAFHKPAPKSV